jgi:hypothetical protein
VGEGEEVAPALGWGGGERLRPGPPAWGEGLAAVCPYWGMAFGGRGV